MNRRKSKERARKEAADHAAGLTKPGPDRFPGTGRSRVGKGRPPGKATMRRTRVIHNKVTDYTYENDEPWTWKATDRPPMVVRAERRAANKRARKSRRRNQL